jgi:hypothetical protein
MKQVGIGTTVLGGIFGVLIVVLLVISIPDLKRYISIATM